MLSATDLQGILDAWEVDSSIDDTDLASASLVSGRLHSKYLNVHSEAKLRKLDAVEEQRELTAKKWKWYNGQMEQKEMDSLGWCYNPFNGAVKPPRADLEKYWMAVDPDLVRLNSKVEYLQQTEEVLAQILEFLRWRHQHVRNAIEWRKFVSGA